VARKKLPKVVLDSPKDYLRMRRLEPVKTREGFNQGYEFYFLFEGNKFYSGFADMNVYNRNKAIVWDKFKPTGDKSLGGGVGIKGHNLILRDLEIIIDERIDLFSMLHLADNVSVSKNRLIQLDKIGIDDTIQTLQLYSLNRGVPQEYFGEIFPSYKNKSVGYERNLIEKIKDHGLKSEV